LRAAVQAAMAVLLLTRQAHVWELGLAAAIYGAAQSFFGPAATGWCPRPCPPKRLQQASALLGSPGGFFSVGGPAAAGALVAVFGPGLVFAIDAATLVVSVVSLALLRLPPRDHAERGSFHAHLVAGWHELARGTG
jgi:MFS family permease